MDTRYWDKGTLYRHVDRLMEQIHYSVRMRRHPVDSLYLARTCCSNPIIEELDLSGICGILYKGNRHTSICLNINRDDAMQNFDCMHELIHYFFHDSTEFWCYSGPANIVPQNPFLEWQANEGAAQALVPYQAFIPMYIRLSRKAAKSFEAIEGIIPHLAQHFNVSRMVIQNRISSLQYEISQYLKGVPIDAITVLSKNKMDQAGISKSLSTTKHYCVNCQAPVKRSHCFCSTCGTNLRVDPDYWYEYRTLEGVGYVVYDGIEVDSSGKALVCPRCGNEEIHPEGDYCKICRAFLVNKCNGYEEDDRWYEGCGVALDGNARYCPHCGGLSVFYNNDYLLSWKKVVQQNQEVFPEEEIPF